MKNLKLYFKAFLFILILKSCSINKQNYLKLNNSKKVELPFAERDFLSNNEVFYEIVNAKNSNLLLAKQRALTSAKTLLSQKVNTYILSYANQEYSFKSNVEKENFISKSKSFSILLAENVKLIDSKTFKSSDDKIEYWAVFSIQLNDLTDLNKSQNIFSHKKSNELLKKTITNKLILNATNNTKPNSYLKPEINFREKIEMEAKSYTGIPYVWGGNTPEEGFDCSGFVRWVYKKSINVLLARTTLEQSQKYKDWIKYDLNSPEKGDLLFFKTLPDRKISHVGIYLSDKLFIHAPNKNETVKLENLKGYWEKQFVGYVSASNFKN